MLCGSGVRPGRQRGLLRQYNVDVARCRISTVALAGESDPAPRPGWIELPLRPKDRAGMARAWQPQGPRRIGSPLFIGAEAIVFGDPFLSMEIFLAEHHPVGVEGAILVEAAHVVDQPAHDMLEGETRGELAPVDDRALAIEGRELAANVLIALLIALGRLQGKEPSDSIRQEVAGGDIVACPQ